MITRMHSIIYSRTAEADRALLRSVLGFPAVDAGRGQLIFSVPPSEIAFRPAERNSKHKLDLMCDDVKAEVVQLRTKGIAYGPISDEGVRSLNYDDPPAGRRQFRSQRTAPRETAHS